VDFRILGPLEVVGEGRLIALGSAKQRTLLGVLLLHPNEVVSSERLADELWGERPPVSAEKLVQGYVFQLRKTLGPEAIETRPTGYRVRSEPEQLDAATFERLSAEARRLGQSGDHSRAATLFDGALSLWRGDALADVSFESVARSDVERLNEQRLTVQIERIESELALGRHAELVPELEGLVRARPYRERLYAQLMVALYRSGRQADALEVFRRARRLLSEELGLDPGVDLQALERAILTHDPELDAPPPPQARARSNLPMPPSSLIGRESELAEAGALLGRHQLLTLTGPGGSGKTRLAIELAVRAADDFPEGVFWVPLQALRDAELVVPTIARAVGASDLFTGHIAHGRVLVLLDNVEQLLAAASSLGDMLGRLPDLKLLVTSREPLHLAAEHEYPVAPLREREAVALFIERATAVKPDFEEEPAVVEICRRLDCLPLALELAAARIKALATGELLKRLDKRLPLLTGGPRDAPERQRTLRATIAWSYDLLTPNEQHVFARLSVFAGGCTLEAAEDVCETDLDTLAALVDKSLLRRDGDRYSLLETIAEYARERLEQAGDLGKLRARHADHYLRLARSVQALIRSPQAAALLDRLERDHENLRAALVSVSDADRDQSLRVAMWGLAARLHSFGDAALDRGNFSEAGRLYRESLEMGLLLKDDLQTAYCVGGLAAVAAQRGTRDAAARLWGGVHTLEQTAGATLHDSERQRYEQLIGELDRVPETSIEFAQGRAMAVDEVVEYALSLDLIKRT
jgi:predicted ATPase/DNA-binding SARP family transcriptional activator